MTFEKAFAVLQLFTQKSIGFFETGYWTLYLVGLPLWDSLRSLFSLIWLLFETEFLLYSFQCFCISSTSFWRKQTLKNSSILNNYLLWSLFIPCEFIETLGKCASVRLLTSTFWKKKSYYHHYPIFGFSSCTFHCTYNYNRKPKLPLKTVYICKREYVVLFKIFIKFCIQ